jgi:hypothetical protein
VAVFEMAPGQVLHGAVRLHGLASLPTPETQVRVACALAGDATTPAQRKSPREQRTALYFDMFPSVHRIPSPGSASGISEKFGTVGPSAALQRSRQRTKRCVIGPQRHGQPCAEQSPISDRSPQCADWFDLKLSFFASSGHKKSPAALPPRGCVLTEARLLEVDLSRRATRRTGHLIVQEGLQRCGAGDEPSADDVVR